MSFLGVIFRAADIILAGAQVVDRGIGLGKKIARRLKEPTKPSEPSQPLPYTHVRHIQEQIRAGAEDHRHTQMRPPPLKR